MTGVVRMSFYKSTKWKHKRANILRRDEYLCQECKRYGKSTPATTIHHVIPLEQRPDLGYTNQNLLSLCAKCHDAFHDRTTHQLTELGKYWVNKIELE